MAIHPIDLQTMYSQMNNVARTVANSTQGAQLAQQLQESRLVQQGMEQAQMVQRAAGDEAKSTGVSDEGHRGGEQGGSASRRGGGEQQEQRQNGCEIRESYLGQHIDITR